MCAIVIRCRHPAHHSEAAHVVNIHHIEAVKREVVEVHPILAVGITRQVEVTRLRHLGFGYGPNISH